MFCTSSNEKNDCVPLFWCADNSQSSKIQAFDDSEGEEESDDGGVNSRSDKVSHDMLIYASSPSSESSVILSGALDCTPIRYDLIQGLIALSSAKELNILSRRMLEASRLPLPNPNPSFTAAYISAGCCNPLRPVIFFRPSCSSFEVSPGGLTI